MTPAELRAYRLEVLGMTQAALAVALGVQPLSISRWELGRSPVPSWLRYALLGLAHARDAKPWDALKRLLSEQRDAAQAMADTDKRPDAARLTGTVAFAYGNVLKLMQNLESMEQQKNALGELTRMSEEMGGDDASPEDLAAIRTSGD